MIIINACREEFTTEENTRRSAKLVDILLSIVGFNGEVIPTIGAYDETLEQCYIIRMNKDCRFIETEKMAEKIFAAAALFNQDSVGFINLESNPPRMGAIDCKTRQTTSFGVCMSVIEPPLGVADGWVKMLDHYYFPMGELTVLDDLSKFQVVELDECAEKPVVLTGDDVKGDA